MSTNASPGKTESLSGSPIDEFLQIEEHQLLDQNDDEEFDKMPHLVGNELPEDCHIKQVLGYFTQNTYNASEVDPRVQIALDTCIEYIERDYTVTKIDNKNGVLSTYYPAIIPFIDGERTSLGTISESTMSATELYELLLKSHRARCRQRFPVPVIMYRGKTICRSATLAGSAEIYGRMTLDVFRPSNVAQGDGSLDEIIAAQAADEETGWKAINELQIADIALLKQLKVATIVDLMVENRKSKLGVPVTSSEKVDKDNKYHSNFTLISLPFPGCEFFKDFHDRNYDAQGLCFNWEQSMCDAELSVSSFPGLSKLNINWPEYKNWDLLQMTQNYIKYILKYTQDNNAGVLIHCISGWDRTPLFISLLRLSLWADGAIHKSLNTHEMLFFTLAYDWMLFGHHLTDRLSKNEDILLYCFTVLKHLIDDQFSVNPRPCMKKCCGSSCDFGTKSPEKKTDCFCRYDDLAYGPIRTSEPSSLESAPSPDLKNDLMDIGLVALPSGIFPASSLPELVPLPPRTPPTPMEMAEAALRETDTRRTSPVEIPRRRSPNSRLGGSSQSGSWQVVSATGSLRDCHCDVEASGSQGSHSATGHEISRTCRLTSIRRLFYRCYYQTLTEKHVNYTNNATILKSILRNLSDIAVSLHKETK